MKVRISSYIREETLDQLKSLATATDRPLAMLIRDAITLYLEAKNG